MHACTCCKLAAQGHTGGCEQLLRLIVAILHSVFVSTLDSAAVTTASSCPIVNVYIMQTLYMLVLAVN
jgi:hypothetical protein